MAAQKPIRPSDTKEAFPEPVEGDFMLPFCVPGAEILMGEDYGLLSLEPIERCGEAEDTGEADGGLLVARGDGAPLIEARP
ncbi:hypothetical protein OFEAOIEE_LOCUS4437 [Methylorubrum extorquens]